MREIYGSTGTVRGIGERNSERDTARDVSLNTSEIPITWIFMSLFALGQPRWGRATSPKQLAKYCPSYVKNRNYNSYYRGALSQHSRPTPLRTIGMSDFSCLSSHIWQISTLYLEIKKFGERITRIFGVEIEFRPNFNWVDWRCPLQIKVIYTISEGNQLSCNKRGVGAYYNLTHDFRQKELRRRIFAMSDTYHPWSRPRSRWNRFRHQCNVQ